MGAGDLLGGKDGEGELHLVEGGTKGERDKALGANPERTGWEIWCDVRAAFLVLCVWVRGMGSCRERRCWGGEVQVCRLPCYWGQLVLGTGNGC